MYGLHSGIKIQSSQQTIKEVVPPKKQVIFDVREASIQTKVLYVESIFIFNANLTKHVKISKTDRKSWNRIISRTSKRDYHDWVTRWVQCVEKADSKDDIKTVYVGVVTLTNKTHTLLYSLLGSSDPSMFLFQVSTD